MPVKSEAPPGAEADKDGTTARWPVSSTSNDGSNSKKKCFSTFLAAPPLPWVRLQKCDVPTACNTTNVTRTTVTAATTYVRVRAAALLLPEMLLNLLLLPPRTMLAAARVKCHFDADFFFVG
jgi:hypothetical protein